MTKTDTDIKGTLEDLETGITGNAEHFDWKPRALAEQLKFVAFHYAIAKRDYERSRTRGSVLRNIAEALDADGESFGGQLFGLESEALEAALGAYPNASMTLHGVDDFADVHVPGRLDLEISAFKKMVAVHSKQEAPVLFKAEATTTGLEQILSGNEEHTRYRLKAAAEAHPEFVRDRTRQALELLEKTFQVETGKGGRNQKVMDGLVSPADWRLMNSVLDLIWPIENGQLHSHRMKHARQIIENVTIYVNGENLSDDGCIRTSRRDFPFSKTALSTIMSYRHQVNTLRRTVKFIEVRKMELQDIDSMEDHIRTRLERLDRVAFYPLLDWRRELERRLREADYRTGDEKVRRVTGGVFGIPDVPRLKKDLPQAVIALKLIRAWKHYSEKKIPPNKGKKKSA